MATVESDDGCSARIEVSGENFQTEEKSEGRDSNEKTEREKCLFVTQKNTECSKKLTPIFGINSEESLNRNKKLLQHLEVARARLRTYAAYSPTDQELRKIAAVYRMRLQNPVRESQS